MPENASPLIVLLSLVVSCAMLAILFGGVIFWAVIHYRWQRGEDIVPFTSRRVVPWGFFDILVGLLLWIVITVVSVLVIKQAFGYDIIADIPGTMRDDLSRMMLDSTGRMFALALLAVLIMLRTRGTLIDLGWSWSHVWEDIILGVQAFLVLALPVFVIQLILVQIWPSEHPLVDAMKKEKDLPFVMMAIFMAVISAPLAEEFFFRTLFQGWLEKLFDPIAAQQANFGTSLLLGEQVTNLPPEEEPWVAELVVPDEFIPPKPKELIDQQPTSSLADFAPTIISALFFAIMHFSHGPDWVALIVLALGLGYLYRRTHRMLPGIVVHFLLNSLSMCSLLIQIFQPAI